MLVTDICPDALLHLMKETRKKSGITEIVSINRIGKDGISWIYFSYKSSSPNKNWNKNGRISVDEYKKWNIPKIRDDKIDKILSI